MLLLRKVVLNLTVLVVVFVVFYCYATSNGVGRIRRRSGIANGTRGNGSAALTVEGLDESHPLGSATGLSPSSRAPGETYNVWCIFTKVAANSPMKRKFAIFAESLLRLASVRVDFHVISDDDSKEIAESVLGDVMFTTSKVMNVQYYDVHELAAMLQDIVSVMSPHFSSKPGTYYSDALFFLSMGLHRIAPPEQKLAVMLDVDTKFRKDVKDLFKEFDRFGEGALFGLAPELTPVYRHVLYLYRNKHPDTVFGEPSQSGGYSGYNSGVMLFNFDRLRKSSMYPIVISKDNVANMTAKYHFQGHLGDQDFYTLLGMEHPELIQKIDCGWNRQLCTWWRDRGYADVFSLYSACESETKLWHGNCNTPIPSD